MSYRNTLASIVLFLSAAAPLVAGELTVHLRSQVLKADVGGHNRWQVVNHAKSLKAEETAIIICDMWDKHWSRGAAERVGQMAPRMNEVVKAARARGVTVVHCPSETIDFYKDSAARQRVLAAPKAEMPPEAAHADPPQPCDAGDGGSDTGEVRAYRAWSRQHPAIEIDQEKDGISDNGQEVWNFLQQKGVKNVILMGVHTNMCVLGRPFAIKCMVRRGMNAMLVRDLTDAMYNPARPPYVGHEEGTRLIIEYVEKFWCPTIASEDLVR
ncbi:MAG: isochorismatase family protein [Thermoguttaceae bacterium]